MITSVKLEGIYKEHGSNHFSLNIDGLEFHNKHVQAIVGPNGSGKSTLLNLLAFLDRPDRGSIIVDDKKVFPSNNAKNKLCKKIGYVRQSPYLFNLSTFDNIALGLKIRKFLKGDIVSKVNDILAILRIEHLRKRRVSSLSRGEYQKVAIAQVLVLEPEMVLMDEPAANIDAQSTLSIEETVKKVQQRTSSIIIMTTHSLTQAYRMTPDIISINKGRVVDFIHENVFFGEIKDRGDGLRQMDVCENVKIVFSTEKKGKSYVAIDPENIIMSKENIKTSARNTFTGKIIKIESLEPNVRLVVDVGVEMYSIITKQSFEEMGINLGSSVVLSFKVNSVEVI
ncbi:MAG: ATP-binding cassette domain-containing protein [Candidatus Omnitrophica bacterium]|nr:ATP-binding cassette domain-containing protein [Candidatus Omnitrophota bacterium]